MLRVSVNGRVDKFGKSLFAAVLALSLGITPLLAQGAGAAPQLAQGEAKKKSPETKSPKTTKEAGGKETKTESGPAAKDSKENKVKDEKDSKTSEGKSEKKEKEEVVNELKDATLTNVSSVTPDELIDHAKEYLGKNIKFTANFSSFCTLALNYKPAMRESKKFISFLVKRPDSKVPLSELKLALPIPKETEKSKNKLLTSLREDDKIEVTGKVFSAALDEPWIDVVAIKRLQGAKKSDDDSSDEEE